MSSLGFQAILSGFLPFLSLFCVLVVRRVAKRDAVEAGGPADFPSERLRSLAIATGASALGLAAWLLIDREAIEAGTRSLLAGTVHVSVFLLLFVFFALPAMQKVERALLAAARDRAAKEDVRFRSASLAQRRVATHLPTWLHVAPALLGSGILLASGIRFSRTVPEAGGWMPIALGGIALVFFLLYEVWLRSEALGPLAGSPPPGDAEKARGRRVRRVFLFQTVLALLFSALSLAASGVRWQSPEGRPLALALGAIAGIVGTAGCALALSSNLQDRSLRLRVRPLARG